jgi:hypothetical protein
MTGTTFLDLLWSAQPRDGIGERWMVDRAAGPVAVADVADRARQALAAVARKAETQPVLVRGDSDRFIEYFRAHFGVAP